MTIRNSSQLQVNEIKELVDALVEEKLRQILHDPDEGLELKDEIKTRLKKTLPAQSEGEKGIPLEDIKARFLNQR